MPVGRCAQGTARRASDCLRRPRSVSCTTCPGERCATTHSANQGPRGHAWRGRIPTATSARCWPHGATSTPPKPRLWVWQEIDITTAAIALPFLFDLAGCIDHPAGFRNGMKKLPGLDSPGRIDPDVYECRQVSATEKRESRNGRREQQFRQLLQ